MEGPLPLGIGKWASSASSARCWLGIPISRIEARWRVARAYSHLMLKVIQLSVGDQGQLNDGPQQQAQASGKFEAMQVGDGTGVHPCKAAAADDHMRRMT